MELKLGYKQTDVGMIPEDWNVRKLRSLVSFKTGKLDSNASKLDGQYPFFTCSSETFRTDTFSFDTEAVLLAGNNAAGIFPIKYYIGKFDAYQRTYIIRTINESILINRFLYYAMQPQLDLLKNMSTGGATQFITLTILNNIVLKVPSITEQRAVAEALSDADALIESLEQLIAKKRAVKQGAMQELLTGKQRLPGFSGEWEVKRLGDIAEICSGGTPSTTQPSFWDGDILWCTPTDITALKGRKYLSETSRKISIQGLKYSSAEMIPANSIVMTSRATIGECAINMVPVSTNQGFKNFVPFENIDVQFLYYLLITKKQDFVSLCGGSTFLEIGKTQLAIFEVKLPGTKAEQTAIAAVLSDMDTEIAVLEAKLAKACQVKRGMMQELLTGKTRLI